MSPDAGHDRRAAPGWPRLLAAGLGTGVIDGLFSSVLVVVFYGSTVARLWQGVASTLLGPRAIDGGTGPAAIGVAMHVGVAFGWSAVFWLAHQRSPRLRAAAASWRGIVAVAAVYGPVIWLVMSLGVIPVLVHRAPAITLRWLVQLVGHVPFVAVPMIATISGRIKGVP